jgi:hypothetical protein
MSRPDLKAGGTKLAVIDHLTLHIYCARGHYADLKVADIIPTMAPESPISASSGSGPSCYLQRMTGLGSLISWAVHLQKAC